MGRLMRCIITALCFVAPSIARSQSPSVAAPMGQDSNHVLRPGDVVRLKIWREPELSGDFGVNESGVAVLPRIGPMQVTGQDPDSLKAKIFRSYREFLSHSSIEVVLLRRVQILGAVRNPGLYPLDPTMTVADALAVAGGTMPDGDPDKLELRREGSTVPMQLDRRTRIEDSPIRSGDQLYVPERRWSSRNAGLLATGLAAGVTLFVALFRR